MQTDENNAEGNASLWTEHKAPDGRTYFYNVMLKKSVWTKPDCLKSQAEILMDNCNWKKYTTKDNKTYYYNVVSKESSWTPAEEYKELERKLAQLEVTSTIQESTPKSSQMNEVVQKTLEALKSKEMEEEDTNDDNITLQTLTTNKKKAVKCLYNLLERKNVPSNATWDDAHRLICGEKVFSILKHLSEKRQVLVDYKEDKKKEEMATLREKQRLCRKTLEDFLVNSSHANSSTNYSVVEDKFGHLDVWLNVPDRIRVDVFDQAINRILENEKSTEEALRKAYYRDFNTILKNMTNVTYTTRWQDFQQMLAKNVNFLKNRSLQDMDKEDALICFEEYIRKLEKEHEAEYDLEKKLTRRKERKNRDKFKTLLEDMHNNGKICSLSLWMDIYKDISKQDDFINMLGQSGQSPLDIFKFYVQGLKKLYNNDKKMIKKILKKKKFNFTPDTTMEEFSNALEGHEDYDDIDKGNARLTFVSMQEKAAYKLEEIEKDKRRKVRKIESSFRHMLKKYEIEKDATWSDIKHNFEQIDSFNNLEPETERERVFGLYIEDLKSKEIKLKKQRRSSSSSDRNDDFNDSDHDSRKRRKKSRRSKKKKSRNISEEYSEGELESKRKQIVEALKNTTEKLN